MEGRIRILLLMVAASFLLWVTNLQAAEEANQDAGETQAQQVIQPELKRRTIGIDKIDTEDFEVGVYAGLLSVEDFGANQVVGARLAYHITEKVFFEGAYATSNTTETSYERLSGGAPLMTDEQRTLTYYNLSIGYDVLPGESFIGKNWAFNSALYVIGGVGSTTFAGDDLFTVNFGAGYRFLATDWLAVHLDARDHIFTLDLLGVEKTMHNIEIHSGITVFF